MRFDELASQEEIRRSQEFGQKGSAALGALGTSATAGLTGIASRVAPLLSEFVNPAVALKGIEKIAPQLSKRLKSGMKEGLSLKDGLNFLRDQFGQNESKQEEVKQKEHPNIVRARDLETRYPQIIKTIMQLIQQGQTPRGAAGMIKMKNLFSKEVKEIEKDSGKFFTDLIEELMGPQNQPQEAAGQMAPPMQAGQMAPQEMQDPMSPAGGMQPQGGVDPNLIKLLQNIQSGINNLKGRGG